MILTETRNDLYFQGPENGAVTRLARRREAIDYSIQCARVYEPQFNFNPLLKTASTQGHRESKGVEYHSLVLHSSVVICDPAV